MGTTPILAWLAMLSFATINTNGTVNPRYVCPTSPAGRNSAVQVNGAFFCDACDTLRQEDKIQLCSMQPLSWMDEAVNVRDLGEEL